MNRYFFGGLLMRPDFARLEVFPRIPAVGLDWSFAILRGAESTKHSKSRQIRRFCTTLQ